MNKNSGSAYNYIFIIFIVNRINYWFTEIPYMCVKCNKSLVNLKMCVVHLRAHSISLKQSSVQG